LDIFHNGTGTTNCSLNNAQQEEMPYKCPSYICFNISADNETTCSGNGDCDWHDTCFCDEGFWGKICRHKKIEIDDDHVSAGRRRGNTILCM